MDVPVSTLRAELSGWIERAKAGEDVVVTDRGIPVARILAVDSAPLLDQLTQRGLLSSEAPRGQRPAAPGELIRTGLCPNSSASSVADTR